MIERWTTRPTPSKYTGCFIAPQIELIEGVNKHVFGEGLDIVEQQWLVSELNGWLESRRGSPIEIDTTEDRAQVRLPAADVLLPGLPTNLSTIPAVCSSAGKLQRLHRHSRPGASVPTPHAARWLMHDSWLPTCSATILSPIAGGSHAG
jgi:hypothetical protein